METLPEDQFSLRASYGTEAGQFQEAGIPSVICGPSDIMQALCMKTFEIPVRYYTARFLMGGRPLSEVQRQRINLPVEVDIGVSWDSQGCLDQHRLRGHGAEHAESHRPCVPRRAPIDRPAPRPARVG